MQRGLLGIALAALLSAAVGGVSGRLSPGGAQAAGPAQPGVVLDMASRALYLIDGATATVRGPFLAGTMDVLDAVITLDQRTLIVSDFSGFKVWFLDITGESPQPLGAVDFTASGFNPADLALSPDGRYVLVSDGARSDCSYGTDKGLASLWVADRRLVQYLALPSPRQAQSVAVDRFGNVFAGDYCNRRLSVLRLGDDGTLAVTGVEFSLPFAPYNVAVSPDSSRLVVVGRGGVSVYRITGPGGVVHLFDNLTLGNIQSVTWSPDGRTVFLGDYAPSPDRLIVARAEDLGVVRTVSLLSDVSAGFYGIDVLSLTPDGRWLYIGNMARSGAPTPKLMVLDLSDYSLRGIDLAPNSLPVATAFRTLVQFRVSVPLLLRGG
jgi:sugar lactone lactonase YvrE